MLTNETCVPSSRGLLASKLKGDRIPPKRFVAKTTNQSDFSVTNESTRRFHVKPQLRPASEVAMEKGSPFKTPPETGLCIPREVLNNEKERLRNLAPLEPVDCGTVHPNLPGYTGHEPQSPKNVRGPYLPTTLTTSGDAAAQGLGLTKL